ncbi:hypothetical protein, partial [Bacillus cereus]|uniref:hypothetical protein n=1 Tax=Bacillus cereus TaxID=1396 RepID=UPI001320F983
MEKNQHNFADDIDYGSKQKHEGSTRAKANYRIYEDGNNVKIDVYFSVRKSGVAGTGSGVMAFA